jgi:hypothetical protein
MTGVYGYGMGQPLYICLHTLVPTLIRIILILHLDDSSVGDDVAMASAMADGCLLATCPNI